MLRVLTRNLFLGADLTPAYQALAAPDGLATLPAVVAGIFNPGEPPGVVQRTDFATRAVGLSDREAILAREDAEISTANVQIARFANTLPIEPARGDARRLRRAPRQPDLLALPAAGLDDAWTRANPGDHSGFTCCHRQSLDDPVDMLRARIGLILTRGPIAAREAFLVGHAPADVRSGLWPSDHAGAVATLEPV